MDEFLFQWFFFEAARTGSLGGKKVCYLFQMCRNSCPKSPSDVLHVCALWFGNWPTDTCDYDRSRIHSKVKEAGKV